MNGRAVLVLGCVLVTLAVAPAIADQGRLKNAGDAVPGHAELTYADLVRQAAPDLRLNADDHRVEGHFTMPRHLAGEVFQGEQSEPAEDILNDAEATIFGLSEKRIGRGFLGVQEIIKESYGSIDVFLQRGQRITGVATHYHHLDEMTSGLQKSDLVIVAGRPSMGKTAFAMNIAENVSIESGKVVGVFSLEMSKEALLQRMICSVARTTSAFSAQDCATNMGDRNGSAKVTSCLELSK